MDSRQISVLLVEDNRFEAEFLKEIFSLATEITWNCKHVSTLKDCRKQLATFRPDIIVLDMYLPDSQGLDTVSAVTEIAESVPVLVLTGQDDTPIGLEAVRRGASEYLVKRAFDRHTLSRIVQYAIARNEHVKRASCLYRCAQAINASDTTDDAISTTLDVLCSELGWDFGCYWTYSEATSEFLITQSGVLRCGNDELIVGLGNSKYASLSDHPFNAIAAGGSHMISDLGNARQDMRIDQAISYGMSSAVAIAVTADDTVLGILELYSAKRHEADDQLLRHLESIALQLANAILKERAENALVAQDWQFRQLTSSIQDVFWICSSDLQSISYLSPAFEKLFGISKELAIEHPRWLFRHIHSDHRRRLREALKLASEDGRRLSVECAINARDGSQRWIWIQSFDFPQHGKDKQQICGTVQDITDRKLAQRLFEQAFETEKTIVDSILRHSPYGIARLDKWLSILSVNDEFLKIVETPVLPIFHKLMDVVRFLDFAEVEDAMANRETFRLHRATMKLPGDAELNKYINVAIWPVVDQSDTLSGAIAMLVDDSAQVLLEQQQAELIATVAHDIKNPLIGAERVIQMLCAELASIPQDSQDALGSLLSSMQHLIRIVQNLVGAYRHGAGAEPLDSEPLESTVLLLKCLHQLQALARSNEVQLIDNVPTNLPSILGDELAIGRVVMNVLHNAIKFTPSGGVVVLSARHVGDQLHMEIVDSGVGMEEREQTHLFTRFKQGASGQKHRGGSGLGLYISKQIITAHNGEISLESKLGCGTKVSIKLPLAAAEIEKVLQT